MDKHTAWINDARHPLRVEPEFDKLYQEIDPDYPYSNPQCGYDWVMYYDAGFARITRDLLPKLPASFDVLRPILETCLAKRELVHVSKAMLIDLGCLPDLGLPDIRVCDL